MSNADEMISQLIQRTQKAVEELDNQNYRHQKMLLSGAGLDEVANDEEIESEAPRCVCSLLCLVHTHTHTHTHTQIYPFLLNQ